MGRLIHRAQQFDVTLANELLADQFGPITAVDIAPLGEGVGLMSSIARATLTLADDRTVTVVVKYVAETDNAAVSKSLNFYANELNFYHHLAAQCPMRTPNSLYAHLDPDSQDFLLVLEDLGSAVAGDQLEGCDLQTMAMAFRDIAELHARYWGKTSDLNWLNYHNVAATNVFRRDALYLPGIEPTLALFPELFTGNLEYVIRETGRQFVELFEAAMSGPTTFIHGDYRIDNMLLPVENGQPGLVVVDWQNSGGGAGTHDIAYFSSQSCGIELRGEPELKQLRVYHDTLCAGGVRNYSFDQCLHDYRLNLLATSLTPIAVCGTLDKGNARGLALGRVMLERSLAALVSMQCEDLL